MGDHHHASGADAAIASSFAFLPVEGDCPLRLLEAFAGALPGVIYAKQQGRLHPRRLRTPVPHQWRAWSRPRSCDAFGPGVNVVAPSEGRSRSFIVRCVRSVICLRSLVFRHPLSITCVALLLTSRLVLASPLSGAGL